MHVALTRRGIADLRSLCTGRGWQQAALSRRSIWPHQQGRLHVPGGGLRSEPRANVGHTCIGSQAGGARFPRQRHLQRPPWSRRSRTEPARRGGRPSGPQSAGSGHNTGHLCGTTAAEWGTGRGRAGRGDTSGRWAADTDSGHAGCTLPTTPFILSLLHCLMSWFLYLAKCTIICSTQKLIQIDFVKHA